MSDLLISLKPKFAELIYIRKKNVELRKNNPRELDVGDKVFIYESSPEQRISGFFTVKFIEEHSPSEVWTEDRYKLGTSTKEYWKYVGSKDKIIVIGIGDVAHFDNDNGLTYDYLNKKFESFNPPQSYTYIKDRYEWEDVVRRGSI
jgi:predicted transcriptional regulator